MNLFYEEYPNHILVDNQRIDVITDFREIIKFMDMLKDTDVDPREKIYFIVQYFDEMPSDLGQAIDEFTNFIAMKEFHNFENAHETVENEDDAPKKSLFSFKADYPYIFSAFLRDYGINIRTIPYMHWWEFHLLFDGLSEDTEIKQRIMYRGIDLSTIKDKDERKRIERIQRAIRLPEESVTDYDIGDALW